MRRGSRARLVAGWILAALLVGFVAGPWPALAAALVAVAVLAGWAGSRHLGWVALGLATAAPLVWLVSNGSDLGRVNPDLVTQAPWPSHLMAMALVVGTAALATRQPVEAADDTKEQDGE